MQRTKRGLLIAGIVATILIITAFVAAMIVQSSSSHDQTDGWASKVNASNSDDAWYEDYKAKMTKSVSSRNEITDEDFIEEDFIEEDEPAAVMVVDAESIVDRSVDKVSLMFPIDTWGDNVDVHDIVHVESNVPFDIEVTDVIVGRSAVTIKGTVAS